MQKKNNSNHVKCLKCGLRSCFKCGLTEPWLSHFLDEPVVCPLYEGKTAIATNPAIIPERPASPEEEVCKELDGVIYTLYIISP